MSFFGDLAQWLVPSGLSAGLNWFGQKETNLANRDIARDTNIANAKQAKDLMDFAERMSGSAYQRQMKDMEAAGINPMLSASMGGSSTPPGASVPAQVGAPMQNEMGGISNAVATAFQAKRLGLELQNLRADLKKKNADTRLADGMTENAFVDQQVKYANAKIANQTARNLKLQEAGLQVESDIDKSTVGKVSRTVNRFNPMANSATSVKRLFKH